MVQAEGAAYTKPGSGRAFLLPPSHNGQCAGRTIKKKIKIKKPDVWYLLLSVV